MIDYGMKSREIFSALLIAASLSGCGKEKIPTVQAPSCPGDAQIESDMTGSFFAGSRRFDPTEHRGEWKMTYQRDVTRVSPDASIVFRSSKRGEGLFPPVIEYRVLTKATDFGSSAHVIASCAPTPRP